MLQGKQEEIIMKIKGRQLVSTVMTLALAAGLIIGTGTASAFASGVGADLTKSNTLVVKANDGTVDSIKELREQDGHLVYDLYKLADMKDDGAGVYYKLTDAYASLETEFKAVTEISEGSSVTAADMMQFAQKALKNTFGDAGTAVTAKDTAAYTGLTLGSSNTIDAGIYMIVVRGSKEGSTVLKEYAVSDANSQKSSSLTAGLSTYTVLGATSFTASPQLVCAPTKSMPESGFPTTASEGEWIYAQDITLKMTSDPRTGSIEIDKLLTGYNPGTENATFVFKVDCYYPDENTLYSSEVYSMQFTEAGNKSLKVDGLPIGSTVKVSEIYSGVGYTSNIKYPDSLNTVIKEGDVPVVRFENTRNEFNGGGGGIVNHFVYDNTQGGFEWKWTTTNDGGLANAVVIYDNTTTTNGKSNGIVPDATKPADAPVQ